MKSTGQKIRHYNGYQKQRERRSQKPITVPVGLRRIDDGFRLDLLDKRLGPADLFVPEVGLGAETVPCQIHVAGSGARLYGWLFP